MILNYLSTEKLTVGTGASANATLAPSVPTHVAIIGDVAFHLLVAEGTPDATNANHYVPAGEEKVISLPPGKKISVRGTAAGSVWVSPATIVSK